MRRIAVISFPGTNCMYETAEALREVGAAADIVWWNTDRELLQQYDGYVLAGGFAYEDRIRAGVIPAKTKILDTIAEESEKGKPVLGICNGAQILVEAGLVPGVEPGRVEVALARNAQPQWPGYLCEWVYLLPGARRGLMENLTGVLPLPIGHGEGRFVSSGDFMQELQARGQVAFQYVTSEGIPATRYPENPNASQLSAAALCDPSGRIVALMPHPERAAWLYQVPTSLRDHWGKSRRAATSWSQLQAPGPGWAVYDRFVQLADNWEKIA